jgi:hypothetical protein
MSRQRFTTTLEEKSSAMKKLLSLGVVALVLAVAGCATQSIPTETKSATPSISAVQPAPQPQEPEAPAMTVSQQNAVESAEAYIESGQFSRKGLIEQLKYEKYSTADATFAVDYIHADWNEQAAKSAEAYLDSSSFSSSSLFEQLKYEGFTDSQARYGVRSAGL